MILFGCNMTLSGLKEKIDDSLDLLEEFSGLTYRVIYQFFEE